jgi:WD40 repeat protein
VVASYSYIRTETEAFLAPHSLLFTPDATHFLAGADSELGVFDISRYGQGPIERYKLRRNGQIGAANQWRLKRGIISTLDISSEGILAAGTFSREIGLYASNGRGGCVSSFELGSNVDGDGKHVGAGISKVKWSACGMYLIVGERNSDVLQVFDVRGQHKLLQVLVGSKAESMMRLGWDLTSNGEVWAGGMDGFVRAWEGVGKGEGDLTAATSWKAHKGTTKPIFSP